MTRCSGETERGDTLYRPPGWVAFIVGPYSLRSPRRRRVGGGRLARLIPGSMLHSPGWWSHDQSMDHAGLHATQPGVVESRPERGSYRAPCYTARGGGVTTRAWIMPGSMLHSPGWITPEQRSYRAPCYTARGGGVTTRAEIMPGP